MELNNIQITLSCFGEFNIFDVETRKKISESFSSGYNITTQNPQFSLMVNSIIIIENTNQKIRIILSNNRIDTTYVYSDYEKYADDVKQILYKEIKKIILIFNSKINRIALNCMDYVFDDNDNYLNKFVMLSPFYNEFGNSSEYELKLNNLFEYNGVNFNSIISLKNGTLANNNLLLDNERKTLFFLFDINSVVGTFSSSDYAIIEDYFNKLLIEYVRKTDSIMIYLEC